MDDRTREVLGTLGVDIPKTLARMLDNEKFYFSLLSKFPEDTSFENLKTAMAEENYEDAFKAAHTLKGVASNLGLDALGKYVTEITEVLRHPPYDVEAAKELYESVSSFYEITIKGISEL